MIDRVLRDDRAREAARRARKFYRWLSLSWVALAALWALLVILR